MTESNKEIASEPKKVPPQGNQIIGGITLFPGEGLTIKWIRSDLMPTMVDDIGVQKPLYDYVVGKFPNLDKVAGAGLYIVSADDGSPIEIGQIGGGEHVSIEKELKELGLL